MSGQLISLPTVVRLGEPFFYLKLVSVPYGPHLAKKIEFNFPNVPLYCAVGLSRVEFDLSYAEPVSGSSDDEDGASPEL